MRVEGERTSLACLLETARLIYSSEDENDASIDDVGIKNQELLIEFWEIRLLTTHLSRVIGMDWIERVNVFLISSKTAKDAEEKELTKNEKNEEPNALLLELL